MGVSILWKPVKDEGVSLSVGGRSSFIEVLRRAFGNEPWVFNAGSVSTLNGIKAAIREDEAMDELLDAIEKHGSVEVWTQY